MSTDIKDSKELFVCRMHLIDCQEPQTQCGLLRSADFQQADVGGLPQRNLHTAVAHARHYRFQCSPTGCEVFRLCSDFNECKPGGAAAMRSVSGQREQPSRPADGELLRRDSSCLLLPLHCGGHFWQPCVCHIAKFNPLSFCFLLSLSQLLHPV